MPHDILIQNGTVIDGSGKARLHANVAISNGRIVEIGDDCGRARQTIDAEGHIVAPGFCRWAYTHGRSGLLG